MKKFFFVILGLLAFVVCSSPVLGLMTPVPVEELVNGSDVIVIGTVTDVNSQWTDGINSSIVTINEVSPKSVLKGDLQDNTSFSVITNGGVIDTTSLWVEDEPTFTVGHTYGFFLNKIPDSENYRVFGKYQGIRDLKNPPLQGTEDPRDSRITPGQFALLVSSIRKNGSYPVSIFDNPAEYQKQDGSKESQSSDTPVIYSITPSVAPAGTDVQVTISGKGFGSKSSRASNADVGFFFQYDRLADKPLWIWASGYVSGAPDYLGNPNDIISWTDTQIIVRVPIGYASDAHNQWYPGSASSGPIVVLTDDNKHSNFYPFTVTFSDGNVKWPGASPNVLYYVISTRSADISAIQQSSSTWNSIGNSNLKFLYAGTATGNYQSQQFVKNGKNEIYWAPGTSDDYTYAITNYWSSNYPYGDMSEFDIWFNSNLPQDYQTISLHEFGHVIGLNDLYGDYSGYPSDENKVMYGLFRLGEIRRTLSAEDIAGIQYIYPKSSISTGSISVASSPPGAKIYLDGADTGYVTPKTLNEISPGNHLIRCSAGGYSDSSKSVTVSPGQTVSVTIDLIPNSNLGAVAIQSNPSGARIFLDGTDTGYTTPRTFPNLLAGNHVVRCSLSGYKDTAKPISIIADQTVLVTVDFLSNSPTGSISVESTPSGARIFLDTLDTGFITPGTILNVTPGNHVVRCKVDGYKDGSAIVSVVAGQVTNVSISLLSEGTSSLDLQKGWNLVSVPKKLAAGSNTATIFMNVDTVGHSVCQYDGASQRYIILTQSSPIEPLYGIWIYAGTPIRIPLQFDTNPLSTPPARQLASGWNIVGFTGMTPTTARNTFLSVQPGWTNSIGFNATTQAYELPVFNGDATEGTVLYPMKGYWIFMREPGILSAIG